MATLQYTVTCVSTYVHIIVFPMFAYAFSSSHFPMEPWIRAGEGCPRWSQAGLPAPACRHLGKLQAARFRHLAVASPGSEIWHFLCELCGYTSINYRNYMHIECTCYTCVLYVYIYTCMCVCTCSCTETHTHTKYPLNHILQFKNSTFLCDSAVRN